MADIAELRRLLAEATPGPWASQATEDEPPNALVYGADGDSFACLSWNPGNDYDPVATAALIAAARNALPELLDRIEELERKLDYIGKTPPVRSAGYHDERDDMRDAGRPVR